MPLGIQFPNVDRNEADFDTSRDMLWGMQFPNVDADRCVKNNERCETKRLRVKVAEN